jgi:hypothetical protein
MSKIPAPAPAIFYIPYFMISTIFKLKRRKYGTGTDTCLVIIRIPVIYITQILLKIALKQSPVGIILLIDSTGTATMSSVFFSCI